MGKLQLMDVQRQHEAHAAEYEAAALDALRSGVYIGGKQVEAFEEEFSAYAGVKYAISCGNGTDALTIALQALGIGPGDEVVTVGFTFFATGEAIAAVGATPVFVDVRPDTYCMDAGRMEAAITPRTKAVVPVHLYGQCADMDAINAAARAHGLYVVEDCAQAAGSRYKGRPAGSLGDIACFSFFPTKNLGADGDGGMIVTNQERFARACRSIKVHGSNEDGLLTLREQYARCGKPFPANMPVGADKYHNYLIGRNSRLDAVQAAILRVKLPLLDGFVEGRRANAAAYGAALRDTGYGLPYVSPDCYHSYYIYALRHPQAQRIMPALRALGIPCGTYYPIPLHLQGAFAELGYTRGALPVTESLCDTTFAIPVFPELYDEERDGIILALRQAEHG